MGRQQDLQQEVFEANRSLYESGLVLHTFGNVSGFDKALGLLAIKPSGVPYSELTPDKMVLVDLEGKVVDSNLRPSTDTPTHIVMYKHFEFIGGVAHSHSSYATAWAQAKRPIPCLGTTHADYFNDSIPCTDELTTSQIEKNYEYETGLQIIEALNGLDPKFIEMMLVASHGPFTWGSTAKSAVHNSITLEALAKTAFATLLIAKGDLLPSRPLIEKHFERKRGKGAYYGQNK